MGSNNVGSIFTGTDVRTRQSPLYDSFSVASTTATSTLIKMFGNIDGVGGIGPETTNMQKAFELQGGNSFLVRAMRVCAYGAAADLVSFFKTYTVRLIAGGIRLLDAPADFWSSGAGVQGTASNGMPDPRAVPGFDLDPIQLTDGIAFRTELVGPGFTTTAIFFCRIYLDGRLTEPV
jgi:hypothetical protein